MLNEIFVAPLDLGADPFRPLAEIAMSVPFEFAQGILTPPTSPRLLLNCYQRLRKRVRPTGKPEWTSSILLQDNRTNILTKRRCWHRIDEDFRDRQRRQE